MGTSRVLSVTAVSSCHVRDSPKRCSSATAPLPTVTSASNSRPYDDGPNGAAAVGLGLGIDREAAVRFEPVPDDGGRLSPPPAAPAAMQLSTAASLVVSPD